MRLALIASVWDTPSYSPLGDIELAFAHLCLSHEVYGRYFRRAAAAGREVILDNGVMELDRSVGVDLLVQAVRLVRPALVTPPEVLGDGVSTLELTREFVHRRKELGIPLGTGVLGVVHGSSFDEWLRIYRVFHDDLDGVTRIGIPYDLQFDVPGLVHAPSQTAWERMLRTRIRLVELLDEACLNRKPAHLLGCVDAVELGWQARFSWVVSNDSSTVWVTTQRNQRYDPRHGIHAEKHKIDMLSRMPADRTSLFEHNLGVVRRLAAGGYS